MDEALLETTKVLIIILLGPPGAGKGTHAGPLGARLGIPHVSTGDLFRSHIRADTALGQEAALHMNCGRLVPDELVIAMLFERLKAEDCRKGCILDGFPRTLRQAEAFEKVLPPQSEVLALNVAVPNDMLVERLTGRASCRTCKKPYHRVFSPPRQREECDDCGGELIVRDDDAESVVQSRLAVYHAETSPLIAYYASRELLAEIDGHRGKAEVFSEILSAVENR